MLRILNLAGSLAAALVLAGGAVLWNSKVDVSTYGVQQARQDSVISALETIVLQNVRQVDLNEQHLAHEDSVAAETHDMVRELWCMKNGGSYAACRDVGGGDPPRRISRPSSP